jgi:hypothetical protein
MAAGYESEITRFIRDLKQRNPDLERQQREARATWWDRDLDPELYRRFEQSSLPYPAYVYQPGTKK